ncbi:MAG TPA: type VI secretion system TssO [Mariniphaga sp.]|nr:type VI secretion system TssO [Mariniphaga sp.]
MKKDNALHDRSNVREKILVFIAYFSVLSILSFLSLYLFLKSYEIQKNNIHVDIIEYKETLNKQQVLKSKIDTIYYQMSLVNTGKVKNDLFLGNYISQNIQETRKIIGTDSASAFKHYSFLLSKLDSILVLKNDITVISDKERLALKDLNECMGKITKVNSELSKDPTRGFQSK